MKKRNLKKRTLKSGLAYSLVIIQMILILFIAGEVENMGAFIISKIILISLFIINHLILYKYSNIFE